MPPDDRPTRSHLWITLLVIVGVVVAAILLFRRCTSYLVKKDSSIERVRWIDGVLVAEIRGLRHAFTIQSFDLATGEQRGSVDLRPETSFPMPHTGNRTWVRTKRDGLELVDLPTARIVTSANDLKAKFPELAHGFKPSVRPDEYLKDGSIAHRSNWPSPSIPIVLADGSKAWIDTTPALVRDAPNDGPVSRVGYTCRFYDSASCAQRRCYTWAAVQGSTAKQLAWSPDWLHDQSPSTVEHPASGIGTITHTGPRPPPKTIEPGCRQADQARVRRATRSTVRRRAR